MNRRGALVGLMVLVAFSLIRCDDEPVQTQRRTAAPSDRRPVTTVPKTEASVPSVFGEIKDSYSYSPVGKRDPFQKYMGESVQEVALPRSPLEQFSLAQLKVTAIVSGISAPRALVLAPNNETFIVRKDMRIGTNRGRIARITRRAIHVEEEYRDPTGKLVVRESVMPIRDKQEEQEELDMKFSDEG